MTQIPDFTETELWIIRTTVNERYRGEVPLHLADTDVGLTPGSTKLTTCPAVFWDYNRTSFVIIKTQERRYRCQFFGRDLAMFRPDKPEYDDLAECVVALLQVQADHERQRAQRSKSTGTEQTNRY